jgi:hypothetical protein
LASHASSAAEAAAGSPADGVAPQDAAAGEGRWRQLGQVAVGVGDKAGAEHQQAANKRVEEELDRRVRPPRAPPVADEEVHRDQDQFPEHVEQHEVERQEDPQRAGFYQQQQQCIEPRAALVAPRGQQRERRQTRG